uniref:PepSY_like domain-containing protein n=2 Tax=Bursaphelenchus xylophilus TaxID=6326 RepID=A0A1I7RPW9_BURXY
MNIFFHPNKKVIEDHKSEVDEMLEVFAGCERPPLPTLDSWPWKIPYTGFYHVIYGNEKAWFMSVSLEYQIFEVHANGNKVKVNPIKV